MQPILLIVFINVQPIFLTATQLSVAGFDPPYHGFSCQVDVIVSPMKDHDPRSTSLGKMLSEIIGRDMIATAFPKKKKQWQLPVEVDVNGLKKLYCRKVFFVNLLPWDPQQHQAAVRVLCVLEHICISSLLTSSAFSDAIWYRWLELWGGWQIWSVDCQM